MSVSSTIEEIVPFLQGGSDVRKTVVDLLKGLGDGEETREALKAHPDVITALVRYLSDTVAIVVHDAYSCLINLSEHVDMIEAIGIENIHIVPVLMNTITKPNSPFADFACMLLSNLTRSERMSRKLIQIGEESQGTNIIKLVEVFTREGFNQNKCTMHYIATILSNVTALHEARMTLLIQDRFVFQRLLPMLSHEDVIRRGGVMGTVRNCLFETQMHHWFLSADVDLVPYLCLPLMGGEEYTDEERSQMPDEMQYLPEDKERESDPALRCMLVEALTKLCTTLKGRQVLKAKQVYPVIRTMHAQEKDAEVDRACSKLVINFITDETGEEDLEKVEIPENVQKQLDKDEQDFQMQLVNGEAGGEIVLSTETTADGGTMYVQK